MSATPRPQNHEFRSDDVMWWVACLAVAALGVLMLLQPLQGRTVAEMLRGGTLASLLWIALIGVSAVLLAFHEHRVLEVDGNERLLRSHCRTLARNEDEEIAFSAVRSIVVVTEVDVRYGTRRTTLDVVLKDGRTIPTGRNWVDHDGAVDLSRELASLIGCDRSGL